MSDTSIIVIYNTMSLTRRCKETMLYCNTSVLFPFLVKETTLFLWIVKFLDWLTTNSMKTDSIFHRNEKKPVFTLTVNEKFHCTWVQLTDADGINLVSLYLGSAY